MKLKNLFIALVLFTNTVFAQDGSLDTTFNSTGKLVTTLTYQSAAFQSVAIQTDGKIVGVGGAAAGFNISDYDFAIARYNTNGILDNSFATNGILKVDFNSDYDMATSLAIQPDGKIIIGGKTLTGTSYDFALIRLTTTGSFDSSFGTNGKATFDFNNSSDEAKKILLQPDGKIIVAGFNTTIGAFATLRCNSNGTLDNSFGSNGKVTTTFNGAAMVSSIALQTDGKIIICGSDLVGGFPNFAMLRYTSSGTLDNGFGTNGKTYIDPVSGSLNGNAIKLLSDGKIIAGGTLNGDFALLKFKSNGEADSTFGINGISTKDLGGADGLSALQILSDGKILTGGSSTASSTNDFVVARFDINGNIDGVFGNAGIATTSLSTQNDNLNELTLTSTGKIIAVGNASNSANGAIVCYKNSISSAFVANIFADNLDLNVYPNPASSELNIDVKGERIETIKVVSINGQTMTNVEFTNNKINISKLSSNIYFVEARTMNNVYRTRFIKE
ncbi:MAG: hypothetical protein RL708_1143 [Bacteroidota bacterium]|jgi:uncharacterized delta-60 repeat protein